MRRLRALLCAVLLAGALAAPARAATEPDCLRFTHGIDLQTVTIPQLQHDMATGQITSAQLVDAYLQRIAAYDTAGAKLNAVRAVNPRARAQAAALDRQRAAGRVRGPLHGIPLLLKDNIGTTDQPTTAGSIALEGSIPLHESTLVHKLRAAGAVVLGKANLSEFANWVALGMPNGYSSLGGQVIGPYDFGDPSGSSAGSGVAAAMAFATVTVGSETSLSILAPTQVNSLVGVKPTVGLVSRYGIIPLSPSFDTAGPMGRTVTDVAETMSAIAGADPKDPRGADQPAKLNFTSGLKPGALKGARLAYSQDDVDALSAGRLALWNDAVAKLQKLGAALVAVKSLDNTEIPIFGAEATVIPNEFKASLNSYLASETPPTLRVRTLSDIVAYNSRHPDKVKYGQNLLQASDATPGNQTLADANAVGVINAAQAVVKAALLEGSADAIIGPDYAHGRVGAAAGDPTVEMPLGYPGGRARMSISFMGDRYTEPKLLGYAYAFEQATRARRPPTDINTRLRAASCPAA
jgi:amidase